MKELNMREMLSGDINRLRYVKRFSTCHVVHTENVAEHAYFVGLYSLLIGEWVSDHGQEVDMGVLLTKCLLHDVDEARTGDIHRPFKYYNDMITKALKWGAGQMFLEIIGKVVHKEASSALGMAMQWETCKEGLEGSILAFSDFLAAFGYIWQEIDCANHTMFSHIESIREYLSEFNSNRYDFMRPLVDQVSDIVQEVLGE
jgi:5'-deoxynucleotidase YfbR-like HD superfamily hydrolase